jgi:hypothetical protein
MFGSTHLICHAQEGEPTSDHDVEHVALLSVCYTPAAAAAAQYKLARVAEQRA